MNKTKEDKLPPNTSMESQSTVLFMQPRHYYMSNAECSHMGNKLCIDCLQQNFTYNEDLRGSILAELPQMQKNTWSSIHTWPIAGNSMWEGTW